MHEEQVEEKPVCHYTLEVVGHGESFHHFQKGLKKNGKVTLLLLLAQAADYFVLYA